MGKQVLEQNIDSKQRIKRILLLKPPVNREDAYGALADYSSVSAPAGLCYIAALMRQSGYVVSILDAEAEQLGIVSSVAKIMDFSPDVVGVTCMTSGVVNAHEVMKILKDKMPQVCTIAGGPHITAIPERTLDEFPSFDILVIGEGEITFKEIMEAKNDGKSLRQVNGVAFKDQGENVFTPSRTRVKNLDDLPLPAYDLLPELKKHYWPYFNNIQGYPAFSIIVSRGCPHKCSFCDRAVFGNIFTKHSPEYVVELIENLVKKHGMKYLVFDDDNFLLDKKYLFGILDLLNKKNLRISFTCESRVDTIDEERLVRLKEAGCKEIMYGIETGSPRMLELMNKKITTDQIRHAIALTKKNNIDVLGYFMLGYPGETEASMQETVDFIKEIKPFDIAAQPFVPFPGSEVYPVALENGDYIEDWKQIGNFTKVVYVPQGLSEKKIVEYLNKCYSACYNNMHTYMTFYKRIHSLKHLKILLKYLFNGPLMATDEGKETSG
jgi:anaerobic magnesium-protoporphyrin IX monomethyl ester cyclase